MDAPAMLLMNGQSQPQNYDDLLKYLIRYFLGEYSNNIFRLSDLASAFHKVILASKDPSIEIMWFYSAIRFHACNPNILSYQSKLMFTIKLLKFLNKCVCSSSVVKKVVVIAPVLYLLYNLHFDFSTRDPSLRKEIEIVIEKK
ncbi:hypothetical protein ACS0TY_012502 [Phlomoides rotata]